MLTKRLFINIIFFILFVSNLFVYVYSHEMAHEMISKYHGCLESEIGFTLFFAYQICNEYEDRSDEVALQEEYLHSLHEIVSYNLIAVIIMFYFIAFVVINTMFLIKRQNI